MHNALKSVLRPMPEILPARRELVDTGINREFIQVSPAVSLFYTLCHSPVEGLLPGRTDKSELTNVARSNSNPEALYYLGASELMDGGASCGPLPHSRFG